MPIPTSIRRQLFIAFLLGKLMYAQGTDGPPIEEHPTLVEHGTTATLSLSRLPGDAYRIRCFVNGLERSLGTDFKVNGQVLTFAAARVPTSKDLITVFYTTANAPVAGAELGRSVANPLAQTDAEAKAILDQVDLLLVQMAPATWGAPPKSDSVGTESPQSASRGAATFAKNYKMAPETTAEADEASNIPRSVGLLRETLSDQKSGQSALKVSAPRRRATKKTSTGEDGQGEESQSIKALRNLIQQQTSPGPTMQNENLDR